MTSIFDSLQQSLAFLNLDLFVILPLIGLLGGTIIFLVMAVNALVAVYFERKVSAFMQDRLGPMEVGILGFKGGKKFWGGIGQTLADAIKLLTKEDILPKDSDKFLMILAPFIIFSGAFLTFIGLPFAQNIVISDFNIGLFYIVAMSSVGVIGIILAGWSSSNKWSLYGAMRAAAQIISYEIPIGLSLLLVVLVSGSLHLGDNGGWLSPLHIINIFPESWYILDGPALGFFWVSLKAVILIFVMMWFRWTFPRLRVDQLMYVCWKVFIPFALANLFFVSLWELIF